MLLAVCQEFELEIDEEIIPKIGFGFAGGIGNTGDVCGAMAGAVMAIGMKQKRPKSMEDTMRVLGLGQEVRRRFEADMGTINCRELTGADLTTPMGIQMFMSSDKPKTVCFPAVEAAYRHVVDVLNENP